MSKLTPTQKLKRMEFHVADQASFLTDLQKRVQILEAQVFNPPPPIKRKNWLSRWTWL